MKTGLIVSIFLLATLFPASAKKKDYPRAEIRVTYTYPHKRLKIDAKAYDDKYQMVLLANNDYSKFFSPCTEYIDSLKSTPSGERIYNKLMDEGVKKAIATGDHNAYPTSNGSLYVIKSSATSDVTVYDVAGMLEYGYYSAPFAEMEWEIGYSTKTILNYECVMAETDYHGRHWTVWFTPDIPIQDGPWKLCGLPELILEASENSGQHQFIAEGIEICDQPIPPVYSRKKYDKMKRKDMLRGMRNYLTNGTPMVNALISNTPSGEKIEIKQDYTDDDKDYEVDFLETDYHE